MNRTLLLIMVTALALAPAAFILIGCFIWVVRSLKPEQVEEEFHVGALPEPGYEGDLR